MDPSGGACKGRAREGAGSCGSFRNLPPPPCSWRGPGPGGGLLQGVADSCPSPGDGREKCSRRCLMHSGIKANGCSRFLIMSHNWFQMEANCPVLGQTPRGPETPASLPIAGLDWTKVLLRIFASRSMRDVRCFLDLSVSGYQRNAGLSYFPESLFGVGIISSLSLSSGTSLIPNLSETSLSVELRFSPGLGGLWLPSPSNSSP